MVTTKQKFTASEIVLLAASELTAAGNQEFSEWDLTVQAWSIDRFRFGEFLPAGQQFRELDSALQIVWIVGDLFQILPELTRAA